MFTPTMFISKSLQSVEFRKNFCIYKSRGNFLSVLNIGKVDY